MPDLLYVNARIKALEGGLMSRLQMSRLVEAESLDDVSRVLQECGYGQGVPVADYVSCARVIEDREREAVSFFKENLIEKTGLEAMLLPNDYHNAKALMKAKYLRLRDVSGALMPDGLLSSAAMDAGIRDDDYSGLPAGMAAALDAADVEFASGNRSPRFIDAALDKAMFLDMAERIEKYGQAALKDWLSLKADAGNVSSFLRCRRNGLDAEYFEEGFVEGGTLERKWFADLFDSPDEVFAAKAKYTERADICAAASGRDGLVLFETAVDNRLVEMFRDSKYDMFSVAPIAGYYTGRLAEIKMVKLAVSALRNRLDRTLLRQRLRELYA